MSLTRQIRRNAQRQMGTWKGTPQYTIYHGDPDDISGYTTLHPTKGWRTVSTKRLRAQARMAQMVG